jgi:hypothetical protein
MGLYGGGGGGTTVVQAPAAPNYQESMKSILQAQVEMAPKVYEQEALYQPKYAELEAQNQAYLSQQALSQAAKLYPQVSKIEAEYDAATRAAELQQLQQALPEYQRAFNALTPGYQQATEAAGQLAQQSMQRSLQSPALTNFEAQVGSPYGAPALQQIQQRPAAAQSVLSRLLGQQPQRQPMGPQSLQQTPAGGYVGQVQQFQPANVQAMAGMPQEVGYLNTVGNAQQIAALAGNVPGMSNLDAAQSAQMAAAQAGEVPTARSLSSVRGPQLASNLQNINQGTVNQYLSAMPGMQDYARMLAQQSQAELSAGKSLTAEEQRMADQSARSAYAARGTALGNQAISAEILNRADVSNQRYQQRLQNAAQAAGTIQAIYQPALAQSLQRQQGGLQYGLEAQGQAFGQARDRDVLNQQLQAQRYGQAMGTQAAGFGQAEAKDTMAAQLQQQRYGQLMGAQGTAFEQAGARENVAQQIQQQRYGQTMGQQELLQGAQGKAFEQAMGREGLAAGTQQSAFNQALQRGQAEQQRLQFGTTYQAGQAQLGAGAMSQLQSAQQPVLQAFYNQPILQGQVGQSQMMGANMGQASGPQLFNPESQTGMGSIYGAYNSQMNLAGASMQANAAKQAGKSSLMGSLGGAAIGALFCWVAREVYGEENPKWLEFRKWLISNADDNLLDAYIEHGEEFAAFISDKPKLKQLVKTWMDSKIS